jgi:hypothetical protein
MILSLRGKPVSGPSPELNVDYFDVNTLRLKTDFPSPKLWCVQ